MGYSIVRRNLDNCYRFKEYNEAIAYAKRNINVEGMKEQIEKLGQEKQRYKQNIENIINPEREPENNKYLAWEKWYKIKNLCFKIMIGVVGGTILCWILGMVLSPWFSILGMLGVILSIIMILAAMAAKGVESVYAALYEKYMNKVEDRINAINVVFEYDAHQYYMTIDNLYLQSLDPAHREMVLMHREQTEHNREMKRLEMERQMKEAERLQEERRTRQAQERLLAIEEERERRYGHR